MQSPNQTQDPTGRNTGQDLEAKAWQDPESEAKAEAKAKTEAWYHTSWEEAPSALSFLFYGKSGVGKTRLAASFAELGPVLFLATDTGVSGGLLSAKPYKPWFVILKDYSTFLSLIPKMQAEAGQTFKTLVLDSVTSFQTVVMRHVLDHSSREIPRFEDWNLCVTRLRTALNVLGALPCHLVLTATEQLFKDELIGKIVGAPNVVGKLSQELPAAVDIVLHLTTRSAYDPNGKRSVTYEMTSTPDEWWTAKDRTGILPVVSSTEFRALKSLFERR